MANRIQKLNIKGVVTRVLAAIPAKNREVLERRFGINRAEPETLEAVGKNYGITRERIRQIQEYGLKKLISSGAQDVLAPVFTKIREYIQQKGGVTREQDLFADLVRTENFPHFAFVLRLMPDLVVAQDTDALHKRYALDPSVLDGADMLVGRLHAALDSKKSTLPFAELILLAKRQDKDPEKAESAFVESSLRLSQFIQQGPFGEYGLVSWPSIRPKGVRDKAHLVFEREKRPLHFKEISALIDDNFKNARGRATHPQTVHNELIKDPRFVLIGRGLYALAEWGYEPGTVKDVLVQILKAQNRGLAKEEIMTFISERRLVRPNTVFLNLQNKNYFKRGEDGKYYLA